MPVLGSAKSLLFRLLEMLLSEERYLQARKKLRSCREGVARRRYAGQLKKLLPSPPWWIDTVEAGTDFIAFTGWALAPKGRQDAISFTLDGGPCEQIDRQRTREDVGRIFWYLAGSERSGFSCRANFRQSSAESPAYSAFQCVDRNTGKPFDPNSTFFYHQRRGPAPLPLPESARISRIQGNGSEHTFELLGSTAYKKLELAFREQKPGGYGDFEHILDWGCGCGRLTRHFQGLSETRVTGADIDADNVAWCAENLPFGRFVTIAKHPPSPLEASSFDLIIGLSIFTHLREDDQFLWLKELRRLAAPDGILLMTVHGNSTYCASSQDRTLLKRWQNRGFLDIGENPDLDSAFPGDDYYRNTFHTANYIHRHWSRYFQIVNILPGYIGHQDLVVMKNAC